MENKGYDKEEIEMQEKAGTSSGSSGGSDIEKASLPEFDRKSDLDSDTDSLRARKAKKEAEIELEFHDGPYAGMGKEELLKYSRGASWRMARWFLLAILLAGWCVMLAMSVYIIVTTPKCLPWWKTNVIYQIYPRSFKDSDDNGIGDLKGITQKVDYLKDLGVGAVLLNSIYESPGRDFGYDITDFMTVDPTLGTNKDFDDLVEELHKNDIKVILDFVPNHSSDEHEFFTGSAGELDQYVNWYTWADTKANNWVSTYSGSAWEQNLLRNQHYLHQFSVYQPEFNLRNLEVTKYFESVLEEWFVKGVDGFSITGVKYMFETDSFVDSDDAANPDYVDDGIGLPEQYNSLSHDKSSEFDGEQHELLKKWRRGIFDQFSTAGTYRVMLSDSDSNSTYVRTYYGTSNDREVDLPMNFNLLKLGDVNGGMYADTRYTDYTRGTEVYDLVSDWLDGLPDGMWPNFMLGHHGVHRIASRLSAGYAKAANLLLLTLPGTPICYYGDELGLVDSTILEENVKDIKALNDMQRWQTKTRDPQRGPMPWTTEANGGFSDFVNGTWLPMADYATVNVESMSDDPNSILSMYKEMTSLRTRYRSMNQGAGAQFIKNTANVVSYVRELNGEDKRFFVAINFGEGQSIENDFFGALDSGLPIEGTVAIATNMLRKGERVQLNKISLNPGEGILVQLDEIVKVGNNWWYQYFVPSG